MQTSSTWARAAVASVGLGAAVAVVAMASRAPLSRATTSSARSAEAPTTALFMALAGMGVVMLGGLLLLAWSARRRGDDPPEREPTRIEIHSIWKLVAMLAPLAVGSALVAAAVTGTRRVRPAPGLGGQSFGGPSHRAPGSTGAGEGFAVPGWLPWTLLAIVAMALATGAFLLWLRRRRPEMVSSEVTAARAAVEAAIGALGAEADPRRAVIAAYVAMQRALGERGIIREPSEAPREYLQRALTASQATEREARTLTGLFEEARYSAHSIPERLREVALAALRSLQRRLQGEGVE